VSNLKVELDNEKAKSYKVLSLEQAVSKLKAELYNEKAKSSKVLSLEQKVSNLKLELENVKAKSSKALLLKSSDLKVELDKEGSAKSGTSKTVSLMDDVCFWRHMGIRERMAGYRKLK
jgi:predicted RNase H-like nuclease (RuvC/YqgF family)